jgi:hypothetical protein
MSKSSERCDEENVAAIRAVVSNFYDKVHDLNMVRRNNELQEEEMHAELATTGAIAHGIEGSEIGGFQM